MWHTIHKTNHVANNPTRFMSCFVINYLHRADEQTANSVQWFHHTFYDSLLQTDIARTQQRKAGKPQCLGFSFREVLVKQTEE
jgi:hypothetical protein